MAGIRLIIRKEDSLDIAALIVVVTLLILRIIDLKSVNPVISKAILCLSILELSLLSLIIRRQYRKIFAPGPERFHVADNLLNPTAFWFRKKHIPVWIEILEEYADKGSSQPNWFCVKFVKKAAHFKFFNSAPRELVPHALKFLSHQTLDRDQIWELKMALRGKNLTTEERKATEHLINISPFANIKYV